MIKKFVLLMILSGTANAAIVASHFQQSDIVARQVMPMANTSRVQGILKCDGYRNTLADSQESISGCEIGGWSTRYMSIKNFFEKYRPSQNNKITAIIYNKQGNEFEIYYE